MKKMIIGTMMLGLLALGFGGTVQAGEEYTEVNYRKENSFTLQIPAKIDLNVTGTSIEIGTTTHDIEPGWKARFWVAENNEAVGDDGTISLQREGDSRTISTKMFKPNDVNPLKRGRTFLEVEGASDTGTLTKLTFDPISGDQKAGNYKATITFIAVVQRK